MGRLIFINAIGAGRRSALECVAPLELVDFQ